MADLQCDLDNLRCTFKADPGEKCEDCKAEILAGGEVFFWPDGGYSPDGTYRCYSCTIRILTGGWDDRPKEFKHPLDGREHNEMPERANG